MNERSHREVFHLRDKYGKQVPFYQNHQPIPYDLITEMEVGGNRYAVLRNPLVSRDETYIYKVVEKQEAHHFHPLEDEAEWERVADAYDEWLYYRER